MHMSIGRVQSVEATCDAAAHAPTHTSTSAFSPVFAAAQRRGGPVAIAWHTLESPTPNCEGADRARLRLCRVLRSGARA
eukprot:SAG31_NODE_7338_length_1715_cov_4.717822_1_plen_79_part_00